MGSCFAGAMAISHAFFSFRVSFSSVVGGLRTEACGAFLDCERCFALSAAVKPGGSGIEAALGLAEGALLRSSTHLGVGGRCAAMMGLWESEMERCGHSGQRIRFGFAMWFSGGFGSFEGKRRFRRRC